MNAGMLDLLNGPRDELLGRFIHVDLRLVQFIREVLSR